MEKAQEYLHIILNYIYSIDEYAKTDINLSFYHGTYVTITWEENNKDMLLQGWSSENIDDAIFDLLDNFIWEQYGIHFNKSNQE